jgi:phosphoenolpyruvate-protein phosphotransferase (PTS system enzyme I)
MVKTAPKKKRPSFHIRGLSAAAGIARGPAYLLERTHVPLPRYWISNKELAPEITRFKNAIEKTRVEFLKISERLCKYEGSAQIHILDSYLMILQDEMLVDQTLNSIRTERINAEWALQKTLEGLKKVFMNVDVEYFRERKSDVDYVGDRILKNLVGGSEDPLQNVPPHSVIVAHDLSPADTAQLTKFRVGGFVTEMGGKTSHTAIMARAMQLPAVVACPRITQRVQTGDTIVLDGTRGLVIINPTAQEIKKYDQTKKHDLSVERRLLKEIHFPAETLDGFRIHLGANMELTEEIDSIKAHGAEGIGLYRTEFLFLNRANPPSEKEHFDSYQKILKAIYPHYATIRTLDIGGDKIPTDHKYEKEINPALGLRAIRFCLKEPELFRTQLRALLRASVFGKLKIMFPMISSLGEIQQVKGILDEVRRELDKEGVEYDPNVKIGIMIEVPSAVVMAEELAREVDFFSIGTNDLIQYTLAIDRANENVAYLYQPLHPAILKMMKRVVDVAQRERIDVSLCGEMASEPLFIMILLGLGFTELSMNAVSIPRVKRIIRSVRFKDARTLLDKALEIKNEIEMENYVKRETRRLIPAESLEMSGF